MALTAARSPMIKSSLLRDWQRNTYKKESEVLILRVEFLTHLRIDPPPIDLASVSNLSSSEHHRFVHGPAAIGSKSSASAHGSLPAQPSAKPQGFGALATSFKVRRTIDCGIVGLQANSMGANSNFCEEIYTHYCHSGRSNLFWI